MLLLFEEVRHTRNIKQPAVNVWYDLDSISEVRDPAFLLQETEEIKHFFLRQVCAHSPYTTRNLG